MAGRIRSIKPEILDDEEVSALSDEAWRLWVSMWLLADDAGNCRAGDRYLAAQVWQDTGRSPRVAAILRELRRGKRLEIYIHKGERYAHIRNWEKHQRIDNAGRPRVPGPTHENSSPWEPSRGESRRISESLSESPLRPPTSDQRPPTNDPDISPPAPLDAPPGDLSDTNGKARRGRWPRKPKDTTGQREVIAAYCEEWVRVCKPADGKSPTLSAADIGAAGTLSKRGTDEATQLIKRYLADPEPWLANRGYLLRDLPSRLNAYRKTSGPTNGAPTGFQRIDVERPEKSYDATHEL